MSSLVGAHGMAFATAMALSGTVILLALYRPRTLTDTSTQNPLSKKLGLRPCINNGSSDKSSQMKTKKKKKRVRFAEDVVVEFEAEGSSDDEFGCDYNFNYNYGEEYGVAQDQEEEEEVDSVERMPANRVALYNGILQARMHRIACSY